MPTKRVLILRILERKSLLISISLSLITHQGIFVYLMWGFSFLLKLRIMLVLSNRPIIWLIDKLLLLHMGVLILLLRLFVYGMHIVNSLSVLLAKLSLMLNLLLPLFDLV